MKRDNQDEALVMRINGAGHPAGNDRCVDHCRLLDYWPAIA
ncbi:hypothetical protein QIY50_12510 [Pseudomonas putida]|nr:hypothetical protein QIY50_12510 [Pseudomonas putida]